MKIIPVLNISYYSACVRYALCLVVRDPRTSWLSMSRGGYDSTNARVESSCVVYRTEYQNQGGWDMEGVSPVRPENKRNNGFMPRQPDSWQRAHTNNIPGTQDYVNKIIKKIHSSCEIEISSKLIFGSCAIPPIARNTGCVSSLRLYRSATPLGTSAV